MKTIPLEIPYKLLPIIESKARYVVIIGGRGSAKSETVSRVLMMKCDIEGSDLLCGREYQNSIDESVHKLNCEILEKMEMHASTTEKKIDFASGAAIRYKGFARNSAAVKSAQGNKRSWIEEAQDLSDDSIRDLLPTIRAAGSQLFFTANPQASKDPFSQRFIIPFKHNLDRYGYHEDDLHLIIVMNWRDNPWFPESLEQERLFDKANKSRAEYDHIWEGAFNDGVENAIIHAEWFDAAVDAHVKLGWKPRGTRTVAHDPSDTGPDPKGLVDRHGNVILNVLENDTGDVNEGCDWATDYAIAVGADLFVWDGDGLGVSLRRQVKESFEDTKVKWKMFKGSEMPFPPKALYQPDERIERRQLRSNRETFKNKRAQRYTDLRDRFYATYRAVEKGEYIDPDKLISISGKIKCLEAFRSEVCRIPRKANGRGLIQIMSKDEMLSQLKIASPNLADSAMMSEETMDAMLANNPNQTITIPNMKRV